MGSAWSGLVLLLSVIRTFLRETTFQCTVLTGSGLGALDLSLPVDLSRALHGFLENHEVSCTFRIISQIRSSHTMTDTTRIITQIRSPDTMTAKSGWYHHMFKQTLKAINQEILGHQGYGEIQSPAPFMGLAYWKWTYGKCRRNWIKDPFA